MPKPRREQVCLDITTHYHVVSRCVRRGFLCGTFGKKNYEHRKEWVQSKLATLVEVFAIRLHSYAIMSNHYHLVVQVNPQDATCWSDREVAQRWTRLFSSDVLAKRYVETGAVDDAEWLVLKERIDTWRERLSDLSWFMRVLNESVARAANKEDQCTGHFWESRYKSHALLGHEALLSAMVYVDLNPIRADNMVKTIPESDFTSGQQRFEALRNETSSTSSPPAPAQQEEDDENINTCPTLIALSDESEHSIPITERSYLELLDYSGRLIKEGKRGFISQCQPPILDQLKFSNDQWKTLCEDFESPFRQFVGSYKKIKQAYQHLGKTSLHGLGAAKRLFAP